MDDNRHKQDVNDAIDDIEVDVNVLARFKGIYKRKIVWKIEMRLRGIWLMVVRISIMINQIFQVGGE